MKHWMLALLITLCAVPHAQAQAQAQAQADPDLTAALAAAHRTPAFVARDGWRHPYETLTFFGLQPGMTVVEISPSGGWYTEILAPYLRQRGQLILAADDPASIHSFYRRSADRLRAKLDARPDLYSKVQVTVFEPPQQLQLAPPGSADRVLTFRNVHNWAAEGEATVRAVFKAAFDSLKPGGVLGVVDHRLPADRVQDAKASTGYVQVAYVQRLAESVGFKLDAVSDVNANPRDTADHPGGVWALPPTFANKAADRARYQAIGESDRFTLRFVKP